MTTKKILTKAKALARESAELQKAVDEKIVSTVKSLLKETNSVILDFKEWMDEAMGENENTVLVVLKHNLYAAGTIGSVMLTKDSYNFEIFDEGPVTGYPEDLSFFDAVGLLKTLLAISQAVSNGFCKVTGDGTVVPMEATLLGFRIVPTVFGSKEELTKKGIEPDAVYASKQEAVDNLISKGLSYSDYYIEEIMGIQNIRLDSSN